MHPRLLDGNIVSQTELLQKKYRSLRYFPVDNNKYCYNIIVNERACYQVRVTFLYDIFDESPVYPNFGAESNESTNYTSYSLQGIYYPFSYSSHNLVSMHY